MMATDAQATATNCKKRVPGVPFKKGHDSRRNVRGRPPGAKSLTDALRKIWDQPSLEAKEVLDELGFTDFPAHPSLTTGEALAWGAIGRAAQGSAADFQQVFSRLDPAPDRRQVALQVEGVIMPSISVAIQQVLQAAPGQVSLTELPADIDVRQVGGMPEIRAIEEGEG